MVPIAAARAGTSGALSVQTTSLPAGRKRCVMPLATIIASQSTGAPALRASCAAATAPGETSVSAARSTIPHEWIMRMTTSWASSGRCARSASARMIANERR